MTRLKKLILVSTGFLLINISGFAQFIPGASGYDEVTLLSSYSDIGGSTRMIGIGGAQNALGGDIGSVMANPAGLGFYNRSEFSFTPSFSFRDVRATNSAQAGFDDFTSKFSFSNLGFVFNNTRDNITSGAWRGGSFGISLSKLADFNNTFHWEGQTNSSILDLFAGMANGQTPAQLPDQALHAFAYDAYLISPMEFYEEGGANDEYAPIVFPEQIPDQSETVDTRGSHYQLTFGYGGNFSDKFYFGANIGMGMLRYQAIKKYTEFFDISGDITYPDEYPEVDFTIDEVMELNGVGINGSLGFIYRPNNIIRLGGSITSPTFYNFRDERTGDLFVDYGQWFEGEYYDDYEINEVVVPDTAIYSDLILSNYSVRTPTKLSGGVAVFFGKSGFISADIDYLNYGASKFSSRDFETGDVNTDIDNLYQNSINYRIGGEYRVNIFRLRAGYAVTGDPYASEAYDRVKTTISGGAGIRLQSFFFDLAYQHSDFSNVYYPYDGGLFGSPIEVNNKIANLSATVGFTF